MKYTKEDIPEGLVFTTGSEKFRLENIRVDEDRCHLVPIDGISIDQSNYPLDIVVEELNKGTWMVAEEEIYQIY